MYVCYVYAYIIIYIIIIHIYIVCSLNRNESVRLREYYSIANVYNNVSLIDRCHNNISGIV